MRRRLGEQVERAKVPQSIEAIVANEGPTCRGAVVTSLFRAFRGPQSASPARPQSSSGRRGITRIGRSSSPRPAAATPPTRSPTRGIPRDSACPVFHRTPPWRRERLEVAGGLLAVGGFRTSYRRRLRLGWGASPNAVSVQPQPACSRPAVTLAIDSEGEIQLRLGRRTPHKPSFAIQGGGPIPRWRPGFRH
jgi:hypothetical protein